jgi:hypothetical protein
MLIGVSAKKQSGKDEFFKIINKLNNNKFENKKFAGKLKQICSIITGIPIEYFYDHIHYSSFLPVWNMTIREIQQKIGTEIFRNNLSENTWINALFCDFKKNSNWIITDLRFPNELKTIKDNGGMVIRIERNIIDNDNHASEVSLDEYTDWDYVIKNNGTLQDYENEIYIFNEKFINL